MKEEKRMKKKKTRNFPVNTFLDCQSFQHRKEVSKYNKEKLMPPEMYLLSIKTNERERENRIEERQTQRE